MSYFGPSKALRIKHTSEDANFPFYALSFFVLKHLKLLVIVFRIILVNLTEKIYINVIVMVVLFIIKQNILISYILARLLFKILASVIKNIGSHIGWQLTDLPKTDMIF